MNTTLIGQIKNRFKGHSAISTQDLLSFLREKEPDAPMNTLSWKIYLLKEEGHLIHLSRGLYSFSGKQNFKPPITEETKDLFGLIHKELPYLKVCISESKWLNDFMIHQPSRNYKIMETEKDAIESVFNKISDHHPNVFLYSDKEVWERYSTSNAIIVKPLISEAPTQTLDGICTSSLEKLLIDCLTDKELFMAQQEELENIFKTASEKYNINIRKARRYARRRGQLPQLNLLFKSLEINFNGI